MSPILRLLFKKGLLIGAITSVLFILIPRPFMAMPGLGPSGRGGMAALAPQISYRDMVNMSGLRRIAFYVQVKYGNLPGVPYWRGRVIELTDGQTWYQDKPKGSMAVLIKGKPSDTLHYTFIPYRLDPRSVYMCGIPTRVTGRMNIGLFVTSDGEVILDSPFAVGDSYAVKSVLQPLPINQRSHLPRVDQSGVTPQIEKLASEWTGRLNHPREKAEIVVAKLKSEYRYRLQNPPPPLGTHPLEHFLFETREGNCEHFAGALCLLLRSINIPSRVVEGFVGAEKGSRSDEYLVRFANAHAWVEAVLGDEYWTTLDATPAGREIIDEGFFWHLVADFYDAVAYGWDRYVVHFDRSDQVALLENVRYLVSFSTADTILKVVRNIPWVPWAPILAALIVITTVGLLLLIPFHRKSKNTSYIYLSTLKKLVNQGKLTRIHAYQEKNYEEIVSKSPDSAQAAQTFFNLYYRSRFRGDRSVTSDRLIRSAQVLLKGD